MTIKREKDDGSTTLKIGVVETWIAKGIAAFAVAALAFLCLKTWDNSTDIAQIKGILMVKYGVETQGGGE